MVGVELDLQLHVLRHEVRGVQDVFGAIAARVLLARDDAVDAVARVGDPLHHRVVQVAAAEAERGQRDAGRTLLLDERDERLGVTDTDVEVAIRHQHDVVEAPLDARGLGLLVGEVDAARSRRAASGAEAVHGALDGGAVADPRRREADLGGPRVGHDRDRVGRGELVEGAEDHLLHERELVAAPHAARAVHEEDQVGRQLLELGRGGRLDADPQLHDVGPERVLGATQVDEERHDRVVGGGRVVVVERVDVLLEPDAVGLRPPAALRVADEDVVARRVDVGREGRERIVVGVHERVRADRLIGVALRGRGLGLVHRRRPPRARRCARIGAAVSPGVGPLGGAALEGTAREGPDAERQDQERERPRDGSAHGRPLDNRRARSSLRRKDPSAVTACAIRQARPVRRTLPRGRRPGRCSSYRHSRKHHAFEQLPR